MICINCTDESISSSGRCGTCEYYDPEPEVVKISSEKLFLYEPVMPRIYRQEAVNVGRQALTDSNSNPT